MTDERTQREVPLTIANGASISDAGDITQFINASIITPAGFTAANLTFQGSDAFAGTYVDIHDKTGAQVLIAAVASKSYELPAAVMNHPFIKVLTSVAQAGGDILIVTAKS